MRRKADAQADGPALEGAYPEVAQSGRAGGQQGGGGSERHGR